MKKIKRRDFIASGSLLTAGLLSQSVSAGAEARENGSTDILEAILMRRSVRAYKPEAVPDSDIDRILNAAKMAATAGNQQPWKFIVTKKPEIIQQLKEACIANSLEGLKKREHLSEDKLNEAEEKVEAYYAQCFSAPVYITVLTDKEAQYPGYNHWDGPLAAGNLMIAARALGYGTVFYTDSVSSEVTQKVLNIPDRYERVCFTPIGVPETWPETPEKKPLESLIVKESF